MRSVKLLSSIPVIIVCTSLLTGCVTRVHRLQPGSPRAAGEGKAIVLGRMSFHQIEGGQLAPYQPRVLGVPVPTTLGLRLREVRGGSPLEFVGAAYEVDDEFAILLPPGSYVLADWLLLSSALLEGKLDSRPLTLEAERVYYIGHLHIILGPWEGSRFNYQVRVLDEADETERTFRRDYSDFPTPITRQLIELPGTE